jgi:glycosyltransferase involved in cell wall biosynthesis
MSVYNGAAYLREAVDSILNQTFQDIEFIVVNDGSSDATESILREYAAADPRVHVISRDNKGLIASLNEGVSHARAPLLARMDADDISSSNRIERQLQVMAERPELLALGTWGKVIATNGQVTGKQMQPPVGPLKIREAFDSGLGFVVHPTLMMRRDAFHRIGGYRPAYKTAEDLDLMYRFAQLGVIDNLAESHLLYRVHDANISFVHAHYQQMMGALIAELNGILLREGSYRQAERAARLRGSRQNLCKARPESCGVAPDDASLLCRERCSRF